MSDESDNCLQLGQRQLALDAEGFLLHAGDWEPAVADAMAAADGLELSAEQRRLVRLVRDYYLDYQIAPPMRALVRLVREQLGPECGNSRYLYRQFPDGPAKTLSRYAGLPKPVSCV